MTCCALVAAVSGYALWQGERALRSRMADERARIGRAREAQESRLFAGQAEHAAQMREWQARQLAYEQQKHWYAVGVPEGVPHVDIAGGTLCGWSAMLTTAAASQMAAGGEITVLDLTGGAVALDLLGFARAGGTDPLVWVLPGDLPRLDLGTGLGRDALADLLSVAAGAAGEAAADDGPSPAGDPSGDRAVLERVIDVLGGQPAIAGVAAGLRVLAQAGDPRDDVAAGLITSEQAGQLSALAGRAGAGSASAGSAAAERARVLESQLRKLASAGTERVPLPRSDLRVVALDRRVGAMGGRVLGTYLTAALTHLLRAAPPGQPGRHTLFVLGADTLRGDTLDRLSDACERSATGLVLAYRGIPAHVRPRLGRGNAVTAFMRLAGAEDARAASEQLGTGHRFALAQLTETIGGSVTDTASGTYTSTARATSAPAAAWPDGEPSRGDGGLWLPSPAGSPDGDAPGTGEGEAVSTRIRTSTAWGMATAKAVADGGSPAADRRRSREFPAGPDELRQLPASAMIISYAGPDGRQVMLADVNPGIGGLGEATPLTLEEFRSRQASGSPDPDGAPDRDVPLPGASLPAAVPGRAAPNLGPPPRRLDWRRGRS